MHVATAGGPARRTDYVPPHSLWVQNASGLARVQQCCNPPTSLCDHVLQAACSAFWSSWLSRLLSGSSIWWFFVHNFFHKTRCVFSSTTSRTYTLQNQTQVSLSTEFNIQRSDSPTHARTCSWRTRISSQVSCSWVLEWKTSLYWLLRQNHNVAHSSPTHLHQMAVDISSRDIRAVSDRDRHRPVLPLSQGGVRSSLHIRGVARTRLTYWDFNAIFEEVWPVLPHIIESLQMRLLVLFKLLCLLFSAVLCSKNGPQDGWLVGQWLSGWQVHYLHLTNMCWHRSIKWRAVAAPAGLPKRRTKSVMYVIAGSVFIRCYSFFLFMWTVIACMSLFCLHLVFASGWQKPIL